MRCRYRTKEKAGWVACEFEARVQLEHRSVVMEYCAACAERVKKVAPKGTFTVAAVTAPGAGEW